MKLTTSKDGVSLLPILMKGKTRLPDIRYVYVSSNEGPMVVDSDGWKLRYNKNGISIGFIIYLMTTKRKNSK